jgi:tetratricopeptide (TPR) repeat protein
MDEMEKIELIDRYLRKELSGNEKETFEKRVDTKPDFRQEVEDMKISREVIRSYAIREEIKAIRQAMLQKSKKSTPVSSQSFKVYAFRIAASILLLMVAMAGYQYASLSGDRLYAEKAITYHTETTRGEQAQHEEAEAVSYYQQGNYAQYIASYEQWSSPTLKATFLAGNAYLQLSEVEKATAAFREILEKNAQGNEKHFQDEAEYYLAMALVKKGDYTQAYTMLETIVHNPNHKYHEMVNTYYLWKLKMMVWKAS